MSGNYVALYREQDVSVGTSARLRMDEVADRIVARDKHLHTGSTRMVEKIVDVRGKLRFPFER